MLHVVPTLALALALPALGGCFSKPGFTGGDPDGGAPSDGFDGGAPGDGAACTPGTVDPLVPASKGAYAAIAAGTRHTCAITSSTHLECWGANGAEQLGQIAPPAVTGAPVRVGVGTAHETGWTRIAAGEAHSCGIRDGAVYCWGRNTQRQSVPGGTTDPQPVTAVTMPIAATWSEIFVGPVTSCAVTSGGRAFCWGQLDYRPISASQPAPVAAPTELALVGIDSWRDIALAGDHACAVSTTGLAACWGINDRLQLGSGTTADVRDFASPAPRPLVTGGYARIAAAEGVTCAIRGSADLACWGAASRGHLEATTTDALDVDIETTAAWEDVEVGFEHVCARTATGAVHCYGRSYEGAVGLGAFGPQDALALAQPTLVGATALTAGFQHACALTAGAEAMCWGSNVSGQAGTGLVSAAPQGSAPRLPLGSCEEIQQVVAGDDHACALVGAPGAPGRAYCWGLSSRRQVAGTPAAGTPPIVATPELVTRGGAELLLTRLTAGWTHTCGLTPAGAIVCWGDDEAGQLGKPGSSTPAMHEVAVPDGATAWSFVAAGSAGTCGIAAGELHCWGVVPGLGNADVPVAVGGDPGPGWAWEALDIGSAGTDNFVVGVARDAAGGRHVLGFGEACALGAPGGMTAGSISASAPVELLGPVDAAIVAAADNSGGHGCALTSTSGATTLACFGYNHEGQATLARSQACEAPAAVAPGAGQAWRAPTAGVATLAVGYAHTVAIDQAGQLRYWGDNYVGQFGDNPSAPTAPRDWVADARTFVEVTTSRAFTCAIEAGRRAVACWGRNQLGELGDGARDYAAPHPAGITYP